MISAPTTPKPLDNFIRPMLGLPAWGVKQGYGSFLTFEFGEPKLEIEEPRSDQKRLRRSAYVHGRWHIWVYCCHWRVLQDGAELAWSEDDDKVIGRATATLDGQKLVGISVASEAGRSVFTFDLGGSLETWPYGDDPTDEQWIINSESVAFSFRADGTYTHGPDDTPPESVSWLPLR